MAAPQEFQAAHDRARMDIHVILHPIVVGLERTEFIKRLAAQHLDKEGDSLDEIGTVNPM